MNEPRAYYNEIDQEACGALRELMRVGLIAPGDIDSRSIKDVTPDDLKSYTQVHLCAGIGVWSYAARSAGWPDSRELWTGSFPCQPYSNAGKRGGADDPRHLWPDGFRLIRARRPAVVMGEQVAGSLGYGWLDGVFSDLAIEDYAGRAVDIPACSIDAPHIRNRIAWIAERMADAERGERDGWSNLALGGSKGRSAVGWPTPERPPLAHGDQPVIRSIPPAGQLAELQQDARDHGGGDVEHAEIERRGERRSKAVLQRRRSTSASADLRELGVALGDAICKGLEGQRRHGDGSGRSLAAGSTASPDGRNGSFWSDAEWLICHDQKARRAKSGICLLVDGAPRRISRWRVAGNAICAPLFIEVIKAYLEAESEAA